VAGFEDEDDDEDENEAPHEWRPKKARLYPATFRAISRICGTQG
jgi:hypothetical protein